MDTNTVIAILVAAELFLLMLMWAGALVFITVSLAKREPKEKKEEAVEELAPEVSALREREREELKAEQAAFTKLMSYNTDMAYGIRTDTKERS